MYAMSVAVFDYEVLTEFFKTLTDSRSYSTHQDSDNYKKVIDWFNSNVIWVDESQIDHNKQVVFMTYGNIAGHPDIDPKEFEVGCNVFGGVNGRMSILTSHLIETPLLYVYEKVSEQFNATYGKDDALFEFSTDGTVHGTRFYSIILREVLELKKRGE